MHATFGLWLKAKTIQHWIHVILVLQARACAVPVSLNALPQEGELLCVQLRSLLVCYVV